MSEITITAEVRKEIGKRSRSIRGQGKIPGIYYGHGQANIPLSLTEQTLRPLYKTTATHVIQLNLDDGSSHTCILKAIEFDPVTDRPVHFDLFGLNPAEELTLDVPVTLSGGVPSGVKEGGILQHILHKLKVACLPKDIPDHVEIDVANLGINKSIHVADLTLPNVRLLNDPKNTVVAVVPPTVEKVVEVAVAEVAAAPAEPEVIGKGKKPEEGAETPDAAAAPAKKEEKKKEEKK